MTPQRLLAPLSPLYALALALKNHAYANRWLRQQHLQQPVLSIGNLSVGGAGKTPFVVALAQLLTQHGFHPDILSRGYGRRSPHPVERVDPAGGATRFGDEPLLIANATGLPVYVGASRYAAGQLAEQHVPATGIHLLDDGFQHRALARSIDIVLLHPSDITSRLLPAGRLREPLRALDRAHILVLRDDDSTTEPALRRAGLHQPIWRIRRVLTPPPSAGRAYAFCAIAHPSEFFTALRAQGIALTGTRAFRDHHRFTPADLADLAQQAKISDTLLTTEKDLVRLSPEARQHLTRIAPLRPVPLRVELLDADRSIDDLLALLRDRQRRRAMRE